MNRLARLCVVLGLGFAASPARALMTPLGDYRFTEALVDAYGFNDLQHEVPSPPFSFFNSFINIYIEHPDPEAGGTCQATAFQNSQFHPTLIQASGTASGSWVNLPGNYSAASIAGFTFRLNTCVQYTLDVWLEPGTIPEALQFLLQSEPHGVTYHDLAAGEYHLTGTLSPGDYHIEGRSSFGTSTEWFDGGTYAYVFQVSPCSSPLIAGQPANITIPCSTNGVFAVTPQPPSGAYTYQWRHNGVPLANSGHISGATSTQLTVHSACHPDTGFYDVIVTNGPISQPSRPAKLTITGTTGVEPEPMTTAALHIAVAGPSPFTAQTAFRYSADATQPATIAIHDITGARIRTLAERVGSTAGVVGWDGRTSTGARAPAGIYYARIESASGRGTCRVVKLN